MSTKRYYILFILALVLSAPTLKAQYKMDLSGSWGFQLDPMDFRVKVGGLDFRHATPLQGSITLPAITDDYGYGIKSPYRYTDRLTRVYEYMGPAWYQKYITIPQEWEGKRIILNLERCHWLSTVYIGSNEAGRTDYVSVPHRHDLTGQLVPGKENNMYVCVDNRYQYPTHKWDHAHTEYTQINWNGILGEIALEAVDPVYLDDLQIYPDVNNKSIKVKLGIANHTQKGITGNAHFTISGNEYALSKSVSINPTGDSISVFETIISLGGKIKLWDEFNPNLYKVTCRLETQAGDQHFRHDKSATFGMREVTQGKNQILVNGRPVHLRGTVENGVFPKTGYAPVDDATWEHVLSTLKAYGMNHMRFHSWCPPEAAFRAADKLGVYFQVELPFWGADADGNRGNRFEFFRREQLAVLKEYGNHPSFVLYCNGNEITGDFEFIEDLTATGRRLDNRHLYSGATARKRIPSDQYYTSHVTNKGRITVYEGKPSTNWDLNKESDIDVPVIAHEAGQRCMYPNFNEMPKYTGPVKPRNFEVFRELLTKNGMADQSDAFFKASGALTVIEYKDVTEGLLRTSTSGGFQLLSINDFPGQGYAFVGILDPFWDSKGLVTPQKFRESCAPTVALLRFDKRAFFNNETFEAKAEIYNYGEHELKKVSPQWTIRDKSGKVLKSGKLSSRTIPTGGVFELGDIVMPLEKVTEPQKLTVDLTVNKEIQNSWNIWVYPDNSKTLMQSTDDVLYTKGFDSAAKKQLAEGKKVVLYPDPTHVEGRKSVFHNHFWNPIMFQWPPMTLGCLIHNDHPVFADFPTEGHTDWQWWDILNNAKVIEMTDTPAEFRPFIQTIDSHDNNQKLGIGFEAKVNKGKLLVVALDTQKDMDKRPATRQLLLSIDTYVKSEKFNPAIELDESVIDSFLIK